MRKLISVTIIGRFTLESDYPSETDNRSSKSVKIDGKTGPSCSKLGYDNPGLVRD